MIPYFQLGPWSLFGIDLHPFFLLVMTGVILGVLLYDRVNRRGGAILPKVALHFPEVCLAGGFIGAHFFHVLVYHPELMRDDPWVLIKIWGGLSSIGGFAGGCVAGLAYLKWKKQPVLIYADRALVGLTLGWIFGRLGCTVAHDHPGRLTDFFLGVTYPGGTRHDLGFYEFLLTLVIMTVLYFLGRKPRHNGTYLGTILVLYSPFRFFMDFLRIDEGEFVDPRYFGLTPAQYGVIFLLAAGIYLLVTAPRRPLDISFWGSRSPAPPPEPPSETPEQSPIPSSHAT